MAECQLPKLNTRVRFPSSAPQRSEADCARKKPPEKPEVFFMRRFRPCLLEGVRKIRTAERRCELSLKLVAGIVLFCHIYGIIQD